MSDGNFNKNLLPYKDYQSGLRAGRAKTLHKALENFEHFLQKYHSKFTPQELKEAQEYFHELMNK